MAVMRDVLDAIFQRRTNTPEQSLWDLITFSVPPYAQTAIEITAGVTPTNYGFFAGDPMRYGAVGDGVTDDTAAFIKWAAVMNAGLPVSSWTKATYISGPITLLTASNFSIYGNNATLKSKANSLTVGVNFLDWTGSGVSVYDLTVDGNQSAYAAAVTGAVLVQCGVSAFMQNVTVQNSPQYGFIPHDSCANGRFLECHFDNNASSGCEMSIASYLKFINCTFDGNGNGFNTAFALNGPQGGAFGLAIRLRSHHINLIGCQANRNGRDGMNVNQGSYAIKFVDCLCWMDNDGGFTVANDNAGSGRAGEGESPRDIDYINCEAYNAYTSGLAIYSTSSYDIRVVGGRYYNNHRCAGLIADATSYNCGIFVGGSAKAVNIEAEAYDERQFCPVTAVAGVSPRTLTATSWVTGSSVNYPRVALYDATLTFQGYGRISSEAAGSVLITTESVNGVTLANITAGWYVTQRVQHVGVFYGNGSQGVAKVDGFGHLPSASYPGVQLAASWTASEQNVLVPDYPYSPQKELLLNPTFDAGTANWTASNVTLTSEIVLCRSAAGVKMVGAGAGGYIEAGLDTNVLKHATGPCFVELAMWVYATTPGDAALRLYWNCGTLQSTSINHPGGNVWRRLVVSAFMNGVPTQMLARIDMVNTRTAYADEGHMRIRSFPYNANDYSYPTKALSV